MAGAVDATGHVAVSHALKVAMKAAALRVTVVVDVAAETIAATVRARGNANVLTQKSSPPHPTMARVSPRCGSTSKPWMPARMSRAKTAPPVIQNVESVVVEVSGANATAMSDPKQPKEAI